MTEIAKFLRKLRIDTNGENLGDMADKLNISAAYLSAIENGKRAIPDDFKELILKNYKMTDEQQHEFVRLVSDARQKVEIGLNDIKNKDQYNEYVDTAVMFAQDLSKMNSRQLKEVRNLLASLKTKKR